MMKLLYQSHSPYARKVLVAAHELGLAGELEVIHHETSPLLPNDAVSARNPLGKVASKWSSPSAGSPNGTPSRR